ncbi:MAG: transcription antitermination factor NusB [Planctomycetaceae bacterium]|nr:transcription antitermination factor NusB [Planctomycetaceae bacterium]
MRRCALQALYQFDILDDVDAESVARSLAEGPHSDQARIGGQTLALDIWPQREVYDLLVKPCAPDWPTHRQPVIDRNILRLALHEIRSLETPGGKAINAAVELAKEFGTEKSPAFVNAVLDRIWKASEHAETTE